MDFQTDVLARFTTNLSPFTSREPSGPLVAFMLVRSIFHSYIMFQSDDQRMFPHPISPSRVRSHAARKATLRGRRPSQIQERPSVTRLISNEIVQFINSIVSDADFLARNQEIVAEENDALSHATAAASHAARLDACVIEKIAQRGKLSAAETFRARMQLEEIQRSGLFAAEFVAAARSAFNRVESADGKPI